MKIEIDKNNLLTIFNENIPQTKEYTYSASGYLFSDFDKWMIVLHKKEWKIINLKNLWDTMSVVYLAPREEISIPLDTEGFVKGLCLFDSFDEHTWKKQYFIPKFAEKEIEVMNRKLEQLDIPAKIEKSEKWCLIIWDKEPKEARWKYLSFLFALILLYGKLEIKNNELIAIKIHIPLFGQFLKYEEMFDTMKHQLAQEWLFISTSSQKTNDGSMYQISCNDYEILRNIANYAKGIEKIDKIPKYELASEYKKQLIDFITNNPEIPQEGKAEVIKQLEEWTIKLLTK